MKQSVQTASIVSVEIIIVVFYSYCRLLFIIIIMHFTTINRVVSIIVLSE